MNKILIVAFILSIIWGCSENDLDNSNKFGSTLYFPLELNSIIDYQVNELVFRSEGLIRDTFSYQLREEIIDSYINDLDETIYLIDRSTRPSEDHQWQYQNTSQAYISNNQIVRIEDNIPYIKMQLPISTAQLWDGNQLFDSNGGLTIGGESIDYFKEWNYQIVSDNSSIAVNDNDFSSVLEISLANHENQVEIRNSKEWYAPNIGLIKKLVYVVDTQCFSNCDGVDWEVKGEKGHIYSQEIINHN